MQKDYDIIMLSSSRWDDIYSSSALCLAKEFSKSNRVFFIDHPFSIKDFVLNYKNGSIIKSRKDALLFGSNVFRKVEGFPENFVAVTPKLTIPINWISKGRLYNFLSSINDTALHSVIKKIKDDYEVKKYILINVFDPYFLRRVPDSIKPDINIYYTVDDISQENYIAKHGVYLEKEAAFNADVTLTTSKELTLLMSKYSEKVFCIPNAADFSLFQGGLKESFDKPLELKNVTQKIICYTGNIGSRINYQLLKKIAEHHSDKLLLMVGPITTDTYRKFGLDKLRNVVFTGAKKIIELPLYLHYSDCTIIPFEYSTLTKSIYPLKINEYLSVGKPVIATAFSEDIKEFSDVAYVVETEEEFIQKIDQALVEDNSQRRVLRMEKAEANTWRSRVEQFWKIVSELGGKAEKKF